jgi:hypothetical protein
MKPISSAITTSQKEAVTATGTGPGSHGLATRETSARVVEWLAARSPASVDKALQWQASSLGVALKAKFDLCKVNDETFFFAASAEVSGPADAIAAWAQKVSAVQTPAPRDMVEVWLAELSVSAKKRQEDGFSDALRIEVYSRDLAKYPADVVKEALAPRRWKFWPALSEVQDICDAMIRTRSVYAAAAARGPAPQPETRRAATDAEKARVQALVDELFPSR